MKITDIVGDNYSGNWKHTRTACRAVVLRDGKLLLSYETKTGQWMLPGGGLEEGEDETRCAVREVSEETGYLTEPSPCLLEIDEYYEDWKWVNRYFRAETAGTCPVRLTEREKEVGMEPRWLPLEEAVRVFRENRKYADTDEMRRGMYLREYTALCELGLAGEDPVSRRFFRENPITERFQAKAKEIFGENLVGVYLHGSAAMGCYNPAKSDLDFIVVVKETPDDKTKRRFLDAVVGLQKEATENRPLHKGIEMSVVKRDACAPFQYPTPFELHFSAAHLERYERDPERYIREMQGTDRDLAAHFTVIRERGVCLCGLAVDAVFGKVPPGDYLDSIREDVAGAMEEITENPTYFTLNLARVLAYLSDGSVLSKKEGGEWGLENLPAKYDALLRTALADYRSGEKTSFDEDLAKEYARYMLGRIMQEIKSEEEKG
ncbi:MAG: DUF4111 domain-containing protein [Clostridia bacterium]|nr:DUF4111 domain-containing protein [Clostridia bacterium]